MVMNENMMVKVVVLLVVIGLCMVVVLIIVVLFVINCEMCLVCFLGGLCFCVVMSIFFFVIYVFCSSC